MILRSEITRLAREQGVPPSTIDKDWVLGHLIAGIFRQKWAAKAWDQELQGIIKPYFQ